MVYFTMKAFSGKWSNRIIYWKNTLSNKNRSTGWAHLKFELIIFPLIFFQRHIHELTKSFSRKQIFLQKSKNITSNKKRARFDLFWIIRMMTNSRISFYIVSDKREEWVNKTLRIFGIPTRKNIFASLFSVRFLM